MEQNIIKQCKFCGKDFVAKWSKSKRKYLDFCNRICIDNWQRRNQKKCICLVCGKTWFSRKSGKYCSKECYYELKKILKRK